MTRYSCLQKLWAAAEALPCPILIVHLGPWLPALLLWLAAEKYIFHTLLRGNAWEYLSKAGQATLIKQAAACTSPSVLSYYIYMYLLFLPSDEHLSLIISNLFKQVILTEERYVPSAGNSTYQLVTFCFSYFSVLYQPGLQAEWIYWANWSQICDILDKFYWAIPWNSCSILANTPKQSNSEEGTVSCPTTDTCAI